MDVLGLITTLVTTAPLHLGNLHPVERFLVLLVAFGPFVVLGIVVHIVRKRDLAEEEQQQTEQRPADAPVDPTTPR